MTLLQAHNSLSYNKPLKWWQRVINFAAQCQKLDLAGQYANGANYFDIRVRFDKDKLYISHGIIDYGTLDTFINAINTLDKFAVEDGKTLYVRVLHENGMSSSNTEKFITFVHNVYEKYKNEGSGLLKFQFVKDKNTMEFVDNLPNEVPNYPIYSAHWYKGCNGGTKIPMLEKYAKKYNQYHRLQYENNGWENGILAMDYIGIY